MSKFLYTFLLQWKLDVRNRDILIMYYLVPIGFFLFIGGIFTSIMPDSIETLIASMTVFGVTMGAVLGFPIPIVELLGSDIKKAYKVGNISLRIHWLAAFLASFVHLFLVSIIIFIFASLIYDATVPENIVFYFIKLTLFIFASLAVGSMLGVFVKKQTKLTMLSQVIFLPSIMISGIMFSRDLLPGFLQKISMLFPATWGFDLLVTEGSVVLEVILLTIIMSLIVGVVVWKLKKE